MIFFVSLSRFNDIYNKTVTLQTNNSFCPVAILNNQKDMVKEGCEKLFQLVVVPVIDIHIRNFAFGSLGGIFGILANILSNIVATNLCDAVLNFSLVKKVMEQIMLMAASGIERNWLGNREILFIFGLLSFALALFKPILGIPLILNELYFVLLRYGWVPELLKRIYS